VKKALSSVLAILLTLAMLGMFAACGDTEDPTEPEITEDTTPVTEPPTIDVVGEPTTEDDITEPPTEPDSDPVTEPTTEVAAASDPTKMSKDELVQYYNDLVNSVREKKPAYTRTAVQKMDSIKTSVLGGIADGIVNGIVKKKMPGDPKEHKQKKGDKNDNEIFGPTKTGSVKVSDVSSASAVKDGANYVITLKLGKETNPTTDGNSKYSRFFSVATRQDVLDELKDSGVEGDVNKATLTYHDGKMVVTVDPDGKVIKVHEEFFVDADAKEIKVSIIKGDIIAYQSTTNDYTSFVY